MTCCDSSITSRSSLPPTPAQGLLLDHNPCSSPPGIVGLWSLAILALERYVVVCRPLGDFQFQRRHAVSGCAFTWGWALLWSAPPLLGWSSYVPEGRRWALVPALHGIRGGCLQAGRGWRAHSSSCTEIVWRTERCLRAFHCCLS